MNFNEADYVMVNTPGMLRDMARRMVASGVRIEIEAFDTGHLWLAKELATRGGHPDPGAGATVHGRAMGRAG